MMNKYRDMWPKLPRLPRPPFKSASIKLAGIKLLELLTKHKVRRNIK